MVLVTPFSTYLSSEDYVQMNESFINLSFTPTEIMFIGVVALFVFIIFGGKNDDEEEGTILQVVQDGFKIEDRLLRPALVGVSKKKSK